jgi:hypothetical protein
MRLQDKGAGNDRKEEVEIGDSFEEDSRRYAPYAFTEHGAIMAATKPKRRLRRRTP